MDRTTYYSSDQRQSYDSLLQDIADYVLRTDVYSKEAMDTAHLCFIDSIGCAVASLKYPACTRLLGPIIPNTEVPNGVRLIGRSDRLDPLLAAFNLGMMIRWLDFNDTWLAAEWGHPSDNLGAILSILDYRSQLGEDIRIENVLHAMIKAHEIQGVLALNHAFNRVGLDHVVLVKIASAAVSTWLLGGQRQHIMDALSQVFVDGQSLRTYRHAPNTGSRKSWAAGDASRRGLELAWLTMKGEPGYRSPISTPTWGFQDALFQKQELKLAQPLSSYVMEHILFKISYPAEFHAQTAVECAMAIHPEIKHRLDDIDKIIIRTHQSAIRIIDKRGPLHNPADRDHCLQYMVAIALIFGRLTAQDYENEVAIDPRIDALRARMECKEDPTFSSDYLDAQKRSIANAIQIFFKDGSATQEYIVEYPIGHKMRRSEAKPLLYEKFYRHIREHYDSEKSAHILMRLENHHEFRLMSLNDWMSLLHIS
jgi:2-methylcitrate dehydratase